MEAIMARMSEVNDHRIHDVVEEAYLLCDGYVKSLQHYKLVSI
jgi:hypothetical protein